MNMPVTVSVLSANDLEKHQIILHSYVKTEHLDYWSIYFHACVGYIKIVTFWDVTLCTLVGNC
jgi:hypothetical protein